MAATAIATTAIIRFQGSKEFHITDTIIEVSSDNVSSYTCRTLKHGLEGIPPSPSNDAAATMVVHGRTVVTAAVIANSCCVRHDSSYW